LDVFDAAQVYAKEGRPLIAIVGKDYGSGSSRDWAAKGPFLLVIFLYNLYCIYNIQCIRIMIKIILDIIYGFYCIGN